MLSWKTTFRDLEESAKGLFLGLIGGFIGCSVGGLVCGLAGVLSSKLD
jgi:hypothetical protein